MNWQVLPLSKVLTDAKSGFACGEDPSDGVFQFRMNNITIEGNLNFSKMRRVPRSSRNLDSFLVEPGDVLFNATNSPELVGKTAFFSGYNEPAVFSNHFLRLRPDSKRLDGRFLARWLQLQFHRRVFQGMCRQWVNQATVGRDALLALSLPLPSLEEQGRIAEVLERAEELRSKRREAIAQLDTLTQAIFFEMFNHPANKFDTTTIKEVASKSQYALSSGPFGSNLTSKHYVDDGVPVLRGLNVTGNRLSLEHLKFINEKKAKELARSEVKPGDVVVVAVGSSGLAYQIPSSLPRAIMSQNFNKITPDLQKVNATYLTFCINTSIVQNQISQNITDTVRTFLSLTKLKTVKIPLPSLSLQQEFAHRVEAVEKLKATHRASLSELDTLFASLQNRAFRGEL